MTKIKIVNFNVPRYAILIMNCAKNPRIISSKIEKYLVPSKAENLKNTKMLVCTIFEIVNFDEFGTT